MFLKGFERGVSLKDPAGLLKFIDGEYRKSQHDGMHKGNTPRFIDELFCGNYAHRKGFGCIRLQQITKMKRVYVRKQGAGYEVEYLVNSSDKSIICKWQVTVKKTKGTTMYGLVGAVG